MSIDTGTIISLSNVRDRESSLTYPSQTWAVTLTDDIEFVRFVTDILRADTYTLSIDGTVVATADVTADASPGVVFEPNSPIPLTAGTHTYKLQPTGAQQVYYNDGAPAVPAAWLWSQWVESPSNSVPGTIQFHPSVGQYPLQNAYTAMPDNQSTSTKWPSQTWNVTFVEATTLSHLRARVVDADTYTLSIDGTVVATAPAGANAVVVFAPNAPVPLSAGAHTFSVKSSTAVTHRFAYSSSITVQGSNADNVSAWGGFQEHSLSQYPSAYLGFTEGEGPPPVNYLSGTWGWAA